MAAEESGSDIRERTYLAFAVSLRKGVSYGQFYKEQLVESSKHCCASIHRVPGAKTQRISQSLPGSLCRSP